MCCGKERKTKKVYRPRHAEAKQKAYKRDKCRIKLNPLDYVQNSSDEERQGEEF